MANTLLLSTKTLCAYLSKNSMKLAKIAYLPSSRHLYAKATLWLDGFEQACQTTRHQMINIADKFREKMNSYTAPDSTNMIFTEDLKNMVHLAESDEDIDLVIKMMKKFNSQNKELRFGTFVFGPVVMRLFYTTNRPELALECFKSQEFGAFFDQLVTYQILLDLLYENKMYNEILDCFHSIVDRQIEGAKYPRNIVVLTLAACYKLNNEESYKFATDLWEKLAKVGHLPMRRGATFCAGLALNRGQPAVAIEILATVKNPNYTTVRNIKVAALVDVGRVEDALPILKQVLTEDTNITVPHTFNKDVLEKVKAAVEKRENPEMTSEFERIEKLFEKQGHISEITLDEQLCSEIKSPPQMHNRQSSDNYNRFRNNSNFNRNRSFKGSNYNKSRPGLQDLN